MPVLRGRPIQKNIGREPKEVVGLPYFVFYVFCGARGPLIWDKCEKKDVECHYVKAVAMNGSIRILRNCAAMDIVGTGRLMFRVFRVLLQRLRAMVVGIIGEKKKWRETPDATDLHRGSVQC